MRMMYQGGYTDDEKLEYREIIFSNTIQSMQAVVEASYALGITLDSQSQQYADMIENQSDMLDMSEAFPPAIAKAISHLWNDHSIKTVVTRQNEFQLNDSASYLFNEMGRISSPSYLPTDQDIRKYSAASGALIYKNSNFICEQFVLESKLLVFVLLLIALDFLFLRKRDYRNFIQS